MCVAKIIISNLRAEVSHYMPCMQGVIGDLFLNIGGSRLFAGFVQFGIGIFW